MLASIGFCSRRRHAFPRSGWRGLGPHPARSCALRRKVARTRASRPRRLPARRGVARPSWETSQPSRRRPIERRADARAERSSAAERHNTCACRSAKLLGAGAGAPDNGQSASRRPCQAGRTLSRPCHARLGTCRQFAPGERRRRLLSRGGFLPRRIPSRWRDFLAKRGSVALTAQARDRQVAAVKFGRRQERACASPHAPAIRLGPAGASVAAAAFAPKGDRHAGSDQARGAAEDAAGRQGAGAGAVHRARGPFRVVRDRHRGAEPDRRHRLRRRARPALRHHVRGARRARAPSPRRARPRRMGGHAPRPPYLQDDAAAVAVAARQDFGLPHLPRQDRHRHRQGDLRRPRLFRLPRRDDGRLSDACPTPCSTARPTSPSSAG